MKMHVLTAAALTAFASHAVLANPETVFGQHPKIYGTPAAETSTDRIVHLDPHSHWVNVDYGETVRFVAQSGNGSERSFAWRFDVSSDVWSVDLSKVAPAGFPDRNVRVYVGPDPLIGYGE
jgi:Heavy-metal resistance protein CzcE